MLLWQDIKYNLYPSFDEEAEALKPRAPRACEEIEFMSTRVRYSKALDGTDYIPGCIGRAAVDRPEWLVRSQQYPGLGLPKRDHPDALYGDPSPQLPVRLRGALGTEAGPRAGHDLGALPEDLQPAELQGAGLSLESLLDS